MVLPEYFRDPCRAGLRNSSRPSLVSGRPEVGDYAAISQAAFADKFARRRNRQPPEEKEDEATKAGLLPLASRG